MVASFDLWFAIVAGVDEPISTFKNKNEIQLIFNQQIF